MLWQCRGETSRTNLIGGRTVRRRAGKTSSWQDSKTAIQNKSDKPGVVLNHPTPKRTREVPQTEPGATHPDHENDDASKSPARGASVGFWLTADLAELLGSQSRICRYPSISIDIERRTETGVRRGGIEITGPPFLRLRTDALSVTGRRFFVFRSLDPRDCRMGGDWCAASAKSGGNP